MIQSFPKIFAIGQDYIKDLFNEDVEITEKVDGSQWAFGKINDELFLRSKGKQQFIDSVDKMFLVAANYVLSIIDKLPNNVVFYTEYLRTPNHNALTYNKIPKNNLALFGICDNGKFINHYELLQKWADILDIDVVPLIFTGKIDSPEQIVEMINRESYLGGVNIEGVVVKNYLRPFLLGGQPIPLMAGKYVSEKFKEVNRSNFKSNFTSVGKWQVFKQSFRTEARWQKAVQHLTENNELENSPRDIGKLLNEIKRDITEEEIDNIKNFLWKEYGDELLRYASGGFPEWYKEQLLKKSFDK